MITLRAVIDLARLLSTATFVAFALSSCVFPIPDNRVQSSTPVETDLVEGETSYSIISSTMFTDTDVAEAAFVITALDGIVVDFPDILNSPRAGDSVAIVPYDFWKDKDTGAEGLFLVPGYTGSDDVVIGNLDLQENLTDHDAYLLGFGRDTWITVPLSVDIYAGITMTSPTEIDELGIQGILDLNKECGPESACAENPPCGKGCYRIIWCICPLWEQDIP